MHLLDVLGTSGSDEQQRPAGDDAETGVLTVDRSTCGPAVDLQDLPVAVFVLAVLHGDDAVELELPGEHPGVFDHGVIGADVLSIAVDLLRPAGVDERFALPAQDVDRDLGARQPFSQEERRGAVGVDAQAGEVRLGRHTPTVRVAEDQGVLVRQVPVAGAVDADDGLDAELSPLVDVHAVGLDEFPDTDDLNGLRTCGVVTEFLQEHGFVVDLVEDTGCAGDVRGTTELCQRVRVLCGLTDPEGVDAVLVDDTVGFVDGRLPFLEVGVGLDVPGVHLLLGRADDLQVGADGSGSSDHALADLATAELALHPEREVRRSLPGDRLRCHDYLSFRGSMVGQLTVVSAGSWL